MRPPIPIRLLLIPVTASLAFNMQAQSLAADAGAGISVCAGEQGILGGSPTATGGGGSYTYAWFPPAGLNDASLANPVFSAASTTIYLVTVTDNGGTSAMDSITVNVMAAPPSAFASADEDTVCANGSIVLHAAWIPDANYQWTGPWGFNTSMQNPVTYAADGLFEVTAYLGNCAGPTSSVYIAVLGGQYVAAGNDTAICGSTDPIALSTGQPAGGLWSGPGVTGGAPFSFDPSLAGPSNTLTYTWGESLGCPNSDELVIMVNAPPVAAYANAAMACQNTPFAFIATSSGASSWSWDFGDGLGTSSAPSPVYTYADTGTFTVTLVVGADAACGDTTAGTVMVGSAPVVNFTADATEGCGPLAVQFTDLSSGTAVEYDWAPGLGTGGTSQFPISVTYPAGLFGDTTYTVALSGSNACGTDTDEALITVHAAPSAQFVADAESGCSPWLVTFTNAQAVQGDEYFWLWGDGTFCYCPGGSVQHSFTTDSEALVNTVTLFATNACGTDTATSTITVQPSTVTADFTANTTQGCVPLEVYFTQNSTGLTTWYWNFNGSEGSTDTSASFTYTEPGTWSCTLTGTGTCGGDSDSLTITAEAPPEGAFDVIPANPLVGVPADFMNLTDNSGNVAWDFGDGGTSVLAHPSHTYQDEGTYEISLTAAGPLDICAATVVRTVEVIAVETGADDPGVWVPDAFTPDGDGINEKFLPVVMGYTSCGFEFHVFDRWGALIFTTATRGVGWDGQVNGQACPLGVYTWRLSIGQCSDARERKAERDFFGHVLVLGGE